MVEGPTRFKIAYLPSLDGFRTLAITPVVLIHAGVPFMRGGSIGVDLFFTLSGFLITSLLLKELGERGRISFGRFWLRRAARLVPALLLVVTGVVTASFVVPGLANPVAMRREALAAVFYVTNWMRAFHLTQDSFLRHTWSLAIEEQYYLLWPILLTLLVRRFRESRLASVIFALACVAAVWRAVLYRHGASNERVYDGLDTRADSLLVGSALAALLSSEAYAWIVQRRRWMQWAIWPPLALLSWMAYRVNCHAPWMYAGGGYFLAAVSVAVLIAAVVTNDDTFWFRRVLALPPMVWVGRISYGIYLWHIPVFEMMGHYGWGGAIVHRGIPITVAVAASSYYSVEAYFRRRKERALAVAPQPPVPRYAGLA
jgi:peptidoglycan/LPS O-acetylase OafA/YrhL